MFLLISNLIKDQRTDLTIVKANFPENTLMYVNQGSISPVKNGYAIYLDLVILAQILPLANPPPERKFKYP